MTAARHPYSLDPTRRLEVVELERHLADLIRLVLLSGPGERLHRPEFGAGLGPATLFEPLGAAVVAVVQVRATGALQRELGDRIEVLGVEVERSESSISAEVRYRLRPSGAERTVFVDGGGR